MRRLARPVPPNPVRWIAFYSNLDALIQPATSAMVTHPDLRATNLLVKDLGHLSAMVSPVVARSIVHQLEAAEGVSGTAEVLPLVAAAEPAAAESTEPASTSSVDHLAI